MNRTEPANRSKLNRTLSNARNGGDGPNSNAGGKNRDKNLMQQTLAAIPTSGSHKLYKNKDAGSNVGSASDAGPSPGKITGTSSLSNKMGGPNKTSTRGGAVRATRGAAVNTANALNGASSNAAEREASTGRMPGGSSNGSGNPKPREFLRAGGGSNGATNAQNGATKRAPSERRKSVGPTGAVSAADRSRVPSRESQRGKSANRGGVNSNPGRNGGGNGSYGASNLSLLILNDMGFSLKFNGSCVDLDVR